MGKRGPLPNRYSAPRPSTSSSEMPEAPVELAAAGRRYWEAVTATYSLAAHELELLELACQCRDDIAAARARIIADGPTIEGGTGPKGHPAIGMLRDARNGFAALVKLLELPADDLDELDASHWSRWSAEMGAS